MNLQEPLSLEYLLMAGEYTHVLNTVDTHKLSDEMFLEFLLSNCGYPELMTNTKRAEFISIAISLGKLNLIENLLNIDDPTNDSFNAINKYTDQLFGVTPIILVFATTPTHIDSLIDFYARHFPTITTLKISTSSLRDYLYFSSIKELIPPRSEVLFWQTIKKYMLLIDPRNFSYTTNNETRPEFEYSRLNNLHIHYFTTLLARCVIISSPNEQMPSFKRYRLANLHTIFASVIRGLDNELFENFFDGFYNTTHSNITSNKEIYEVIFSNPYACARAFKDNNSAFLPFCDVEKAHLESPEYFV